MHTLLAIDLGTNCGYTVGTADNHISGAWNLKGGRFEGGGMRFVHFRKYLNDVGAAFEIDQVFFEEVRRHQGVDAAHVYGGLLAVLQEWCETRGIPYSGLPVGEIKKSFTGSGNAGKDAMMLVAEDMGYQPKSSDEADAIAIFHLGLSKI